LGKTLAAYSTVYAHLRQHKIYTKLETFSFGMDMVHYLGYIVDQHGVYVDLAKIQVIGNYSYGSDFINFSPLSSDVPLTQKSKMTFQLNLLGAAEQSIFCQNPLSRATDKEGQGEKITRHEEVTKFFSQFWTLYFDGSKSQVSGAGFILINPKGK
jgi:hypothetical protein